MVTDRLSGWNDFLRLLRYEFITEARNHSVELTVRVLKLVPAKIAVKLVCNSAVWITTVPASGVSQTNATVTATGTKTPHESPWAGFSVSRHPGGSAWHQSRSGWKRDWTEQKNISFLLVFGYRLLTSARRYPKSVLNQLRKVSILAGERTFHSFLCAFKKQYYEYFSLFIFFVFLCLKAVKNVTCETPTPATMVMHCDILKYVCRWMKSSKKGKLLTVGERNWSTISSWTAGWTWALAQEEEEEEERRGSGGCLQTSACKCRSDSR